MLTIQTNNTRRAAVRSRVNDENAVPRANNAVRAAKPATRSGITQKEGNIKEVNGKTDTKRTRKALEAVVVRCLACLLRCARAEW